MSFTLTPGTEPNMMRLFSSPHAPNPRRVRIFLAEKSVSVPVIDIDLATDQHRSTDYSAVNPLQRTPALQLDDGEIITETVAICRYIEHLHPDPVLFGSPGLESARVEMWQRRVELNLFMHIANAYRHAHPGAKTLEIPQISAMAEASRPKALEFMAFLDRELAARPFIAGRFSIADITGLVALDFLRPARIDMPEGLHNLRRWHNDLRTRPSAKA